MASLLKDSGASGGADAELQAIDDLLGAVGLTHGRRRLLAAGYTPQARHPRQEAPERQERAAQSAAVATLRAGILSAVGIAHGFSTRPGGVSTVYAGGDPDARMDDVLGELNLGFTASDTEENVAENRARLLRETFGETLPLVTLRQIHSNVTYRVTRADASARAVLRGDGLMTDDPGVALGIQTADCVPVIVADPVQGAVAVFHAGWRGTLKRIVEGGVGRMRLEFGSNPKDLVAAIGPSIGACCYAVGDEVEYAFRSQFSYSESLFCEVSDSDPVKKKYPMLFLTMRAPGHSDMGPSIHLDLAEANRRQLLDAGLSSEKIEVSGKCTSCRTDLFYSHRAEHGFAGRMLSVVTASAR